MSNSSCKFDYFSYKSSQQICKLVKECDYTFINFYELHYCTFNGNSYISLTILSVICLICFYLLSDTANRYLSQALTNISDKLKLSQNLAGVTILAFGNGANDVLSSIIASDGQGEEGLDVALGSLLGGGIFVSCLVFSLVIMIAKNINVLL